MKALPLYWSCYEWKYHVIPYQHMPQTWKWISGKILAITISFLYIDFHCYKNDKKTIIWQKSLKNKSSKWISVEKKKNPICIRYQLSEHLMHLNTSRCERNPQGSAGRNLYKCTTLLMALLFNLMSSVTVEWKTTSLKRNQCCHMMRHHDCVIVDTSVAVYAVRTRTAAILECCIMKHWGRSMVVMSHTDIVHQDTLSPSQKPYLAFRMKYATKKTPHCMDALKECQLNTEYYLVMSNRFMFL